MQEDVEAPQIKVVFQIPRFWHSTPNELGRFCSFGHETFLAQDYVTLRKAATNKSGDSLQSTGHLDQMV